MWKCDILTIAKWLSVKNTLIKVCYKNLTKEKILSKKDVFPSVKKKVLEMESDDIALKSMEIKNMYVVEYNGKLYYFCDVHTSSGLSYFMIPVWLDWCGKV